MSADVAALIARVLWAGFGLGAVLGFVAARTNFCTMGALADGMLFGDWGRLRAWTLAIAVAVAATSLLAAGGQIDTARALYAAPRLYWLAHLVGGACFGVGMVLASGCGNKTLLRLAGGNLKALVVLLVMGLTAWITLRGVLAVFRIEVLQAPALTLVLPAPQTLPHLLQGGLGLGLAQWQAALGLAVALGLTFHAFASREFRRSPERWLGGIAVGLVVAAGWYVTGHLAVGENPETLEDTVFATSSHLAESMSFVAPAAYLLELLSFWTDSGTRLSFGVATALGVVAGAFLQGLVSRSLRWEAFTGAADMGRHLAGAVLMGFGGVTALGCSIGQGISGVATLSLGSWLSLAAIAGGAVATLAWQARRA